MEIDSPNAIGISTGFGIPTGGTNNQILLKDSSTNYATTWVNYIPTGGTNNQILLKDSSTNYSTTWVNYIPTGGTANQIISKVDGTNYNTQWINNTSLSTITKISTHGYNGGLLIADGKVLTFNGIEGNVNYTRGVYTGTGNEASGLLNTREIVFPGETGTLIDSGIHGSQAYALFNSGNLWMWGYNGRGALGVGNTTDVYYLPVLSTTNVSKFYSHPSQDARNDAYTHFMILKTDGKVYATGYNGFGQLGLGNTTDRSSWTEVTGAGTNPRNVWVLGNYTSSTVIEKSDGSIWICGYNAFGQLGLGNTTQIISTLTNTGTGWNGGDTSMRIQQIGFGGGYTDGSGTAENVSIAMFMDNGTTSRIATCGNNTWGQLGDTTTTQRTIPIVPTGINFRVSKMVWAGGSAGSCWILKTDGTLWNWGYGLNGQLDRGNTTQNNPTPQQVETAVLDVLIHNHSWVGFAFQTASPIIRKADGYYRCGYNGHGQVGDGTTTSRSNLVKIRLPQGLVFNYFGAMGSQSNEQQTFIGVDSTNHLWAWGQNTAYAIVSVGSGTIMPQPVKITPTALIK
jgi:alpha-tubulin suppressor-like RCC1 family protein